MDKDKRDLVLYWWNKSQECIDVADREINAHSYGIVINRLYYALFYAVTAALFERGLSYKKHSGVKSAFHKELVNKGLIDPQVAMVYDQLFEDRLESDYIAFSEFENEYVERLYAQCILLLNALKKIIQSIP